MKRKEWQVFDEGGKWRTVVTKMPPGEDWLATFCWRGGRNGCGLGVLYGGEGVRNGRCGQFTSTVE